MWYGHLSARLGRREEAQAALEELRRRALDGYVPIVYEAHVLVGLGNRDEAFRLYEVACQQRSGLLLWARVDAFMDPLRSDPRFGALLETISEHA